ncbi:DUF4012 domain-containing protein [Candidatus Falkowbacteria bacterium]|nr:MAG: DUF4012 domain-containing protein [Candidatus Falkowbacteria bacterium]
MYSYQRINRFEIVFRRLTVVRIFFWFGRIFQRVFSLIGKVLFRGLRFLGLFVIEVGYGIKLKLVDWRYARKKEKIQLRSFFYFFFSVLWMIPKDILRSIKRIGESSKPPVTKIPKVVVKERPLELKPSSPEMVQWSFKWSIVNFVLTLLLIISPIIIFAQWRKLDGIKQAVLSSGVAAYEKLFLAKDFLEKQNVPQAQTAFSDASKNFLQAQQDLSAVNSFLFEVAAYVPNKSARLAASGPHLLKAGKLSSELGTELSQALVLPPGQEPNVNNFLQNFLLHAEPSLDIAKSLEKEMAKIDSQTLPDTYRQQFVELRGKMHFLSQSLGESITLAKESLIFLGEKVDKRYMLVFQNNTEKRGSGGFIGSFALVDIRRGQITNLTVPKGGTYDTEAGLSRLVAAPEPLRLLNPRWHFWDANWWPDWPTSAKKLMWFYENSNGPSVDGVISLTPTVIERALEVIGPIDMTADYGVVIDSQNFWTTTQTFAEQKPDITKEPKKIIGDLINRIMEELPKRLTPEKTIALIAVMEENLNQKQIMAYFEDPVLQASTKRFGWAGNIQETTGDYLLVTNTNIGGQKTDKVISETLDHESEILPDGSIIDTLTIRRQHNGIRGDTFVGVRNNDWMRIYVPKDSQLLSATGFKSPDKSLFEVANPKSEKDPDLQAEANAQIDVLSNTKIYTENNKTVFANWSMVDPGETTVITIQYKLPFKVISKSETGWRKLINKFIQTEPSLNHTLLVQKQPGALSTVLQSRLKIQDNRTIYWQYPEGKKTNDGWSITTPLDTDFFAAILYK